MTRQKRRAGVTLIEVLIALGVLALGIICIMSMFPLAAFQMAQAVKDDRCATLAANSDTMAKIMWRAAWESTTSPGGIETNEATVFGREPGLAYLDNNGVNSVATTSPGPSLPVYFDPIGVTSNTSATLQTWVAGRPGVLVRAPIAAAMVQPPQSCIRLCSVLDDMSFGPSGAPDLSTGQIDRGGMFSVAWLLQRRNNSIRSEANVTVVVYSKRPPAVTPSLEFPMVGTVNNGTTGVVLNTGGIALSIRKGSWILDVSQLQSATGAIDYRGDFYRVVGYTAGNGFISLELQNPVRQHPNTTIPVWTPAAPSTYTGTFFVLDGVVEVFDRGTVSAIGSPAQ